MSDNTTELQPCPFCGGEAKVNTLKWAGGYTATALCKNEPNGHYLNTWDEDEEKAIGRIIEAWNRRAERTCEVVASELDGQMWVYRHEFSCDCGQRNYFTASSEPPKYCPNCGAKVVDA